VTRAARCHALAAGALGALLGTAPAHAFSTGISGFSGRQGPICNFCHAGGTAPAVAFEGPSQVAPGAAVTLRFAVTAPNAAQRAAGLNVAAQIGGGTLATLAGQGTRLSANELTHTAPKLNSDGVTSWELRWTAPAAPGRYRVFGAGNAVNLNGANTGDRAAAATIDIDVVATTDTPTATPTPTATGTPPPGSTATPAASPSPEPPACAGDCDGDGQVAINELVSAVAIALETQPTASCRAVDRDADGAVSIAELIAAVGAALAGC